MKVPVSWLNEFVERIATVFFFFLRDTAKGGKWAGKKWGFGGKKREGRRGHRKGGMDVIRAAGGGDKGGLAFE